MCQTSNHQTNPSAASPATRVRKRPLFPLGRVVATPGVLEHLALHAVDPAYYLKRHESGDWGDDLSQADKDANKRAVVEATRIFSAYSVAGERVYVITEWDRSVTTLLFPSEY